MRKTKLKSLLAPSGGTVRTLAQEEEAILKRPELLCTHHGGYETGDTDSWSVRHYQILHPYVNNSSLMGVQLIDRVVTPSKPLSSVDMVTQLSGLYYVESYKEDETYDETKAKSVEGLIQLRGRLWQQTEGSETWVLKEDSGNVYEPLSYVIINQSGSCHFLTASFWQWKNAVRGNAFSLREGLLDLQQQGSDYGCWEQRIVAVPTTSIDWDRPFRLTLDVVIHHGLNAAFPAEYEEFPKWNDPQLGATLPGIEGRPAEANMMVKLTGFAAWGKA